MVGNCQPMMARVRRFQYDVTALLIYLLATVIFAVQLD